MLNEIHAHLGPGSVHYWRSKHGNEVVVASDVDRPVVKRYGDLVVRWVSPGQLIDEVTRPSQKPR